MSRRPYAEGDWFAVPTSVGYVLSRIARVGRSGALAAYFFTPLLSAEPTIDDTAGLEAEDAFYITRVSDLGLVEDGWPIIKSVDMWTREKWPLPRFGRIDMFRPGLAFAVRYDENNLHKQLDKIKITVEQALMLPQDGYSGHRYLQERLVRYFNEAQPKYEPSEYLRLYTWFQGLPKDDAT